MSFFATLLTNDPESTTTCRAGGLDFRPSAEKTKKDRSTFCVELATGCKAPGFYGKNNSIKALLFKIL
jgi:hypothetical protein